MRKDLVAGGAATVILMLISYWVLASAALPVPAVMTNMTLYVAFVGLGFLVLGMLLRSTQRTRR